MPDWSREGDNMGIGSVGSDISYYGYGSTSSVKSSVQTESFSNDSSKSSGDVLSYYQDLCKEFAGISFRLDDVSEASKHGNSPFLGYNNSFNQVGSNFGNKGQCSITIDASVIKRMQEDPRYEQAVKGMIENTRSRYSEFEAGALKDGYQYVSVSIEDNNGKPQRGTIQSNYPYSTEDEVKSMWNMGEYSNRVISIIDDIKNDAVDAFFKMYDESAAGRVNASTSEKPSIPEWQMNLTCKEAAESTKEDPVYEVTTTIDGEEFIQKIHINDFKPTNATQAEMCAMFAYYDSINGTEGTYDKFMAYMETGMLHGRWDGNETYDDFTSKRYDFRHISAEVPSDLYRVGLTKDVYKEAWEIHDIIEKDFINKYSAEIGDDLPKYVRENGILMEHKMTASMPDIPQDIAVALTKFFYEDESIVEKYGSDFIGELYINLEFDIAKRIDEDGTRGDIEGMWNSAISVLESLSEQLDTFFGDKLGNVDAVKAQVEELKELYNKAIDDLKKAKDEALSETETEESEEDIFRKMLVDYIAEMYQKIINGDTEQEFQIGSISLTLDEWDELIEKFDDLEEEIKEAVKAKIEKQKEIERTAESSKTDDSINNVAFLSSETRKTVFREETDNKPEISYITCFTEDGIICKKTGMGENEYLWKMDYRDEQDYEKVMDLLHSFPEDWDLRFSSNEKFWKDYLAERVDKDDLVSNVNEYSDKGKMNFFIERDGNTYINPAAAKYANYMNSPEARIYNAEEFTEIIANELRENQRKLVDPDNADALKFIDERIEDFKRHMLGENYNKVNHKNYYSNNYTWQADNAEGLFRIYGRDGELLSTIGYADLLNIDEDVLISEYGFNDELFRTLSYVREE